MNAKAPKDPIRRKIARLLTALDGVVAAAKEAEKAREALVRAVSRPSRLRLVGTGENGDGHN